MPVLNERDIEAAQTYLKKRLDAELSMDYNLQIVMRGAAKRIVEICYSYNVSPQSFYFNANTKMQMDIDAVIQWLYDVILDYFETLAVTQDSDHKDEVLAYILAKFHGQTFEQRLNSYVGKYRNELEILIGAGLIVGLTKTALTQSISTNLLNPWGNEIVKEAQVSAPSYGKGVPTAMYSAISNLTRNGIGRGYMYDRHLSATENEAVGFMTFRNSTYPCDICDDYAIDFHPMGDTIPPLHLHCVCGTVYFNIFGEPINL